MIPSLPDLAGRIADAIHHFSAVDALEWTGSLLGLLGAILLALHTRISRYGWLAFIAANLVTILFAYAIDRYGLLTQQVGFVCTSALGLVRSGLLRSRGHTVSAATSHIASR